MALDGGMMGDRHASIPHTGCYQKAPVLHHDGNLGETGGEKDGMLGTATPAERSGLLGPSTSKPTPKARASFAHVAPPVNL